jgi:hypothetical protein
VCICLCLEKDGSEASCRVPLVSVLIDLGCLIVGECGLFVVIFDIALKN